MGVGWTLWEVRVEPEGSHVGARAASVVRCSKRRGLPRSSVWRTLEFRVGIEDGTRDLSCWVHVELAGGS
eukprot:4637804-Prorocentrum_lima.AAC.1